MIDFAAILKDGNRLKSFPPIRIIERDTDVFVTYNKQKTRLDRIAFDIYRDETCWRIILWANPEFFIEFDIPDNTVIRVPFPLEDVQQELVRKITQGRNRENVQI